MALIKIDKMMGRFLNVELNRENVFSISIFEFGNDRIAKHLLKINI